MLSANNESSGSHTAQQGPFDQQSGSQIQVDAFSEERAGISAGVSLSVNNSSSSDARVGDGKGSTGTIPRVQPATETLEERIVAVLRCEVCFDLRRTSMYLCKEGHSICAPCLTDLSAEARIYRVPPKCLCCETDISVTVRNIAVEKAIQELSSNCQYCSEKLPYKFLDNHERYECSVYPTMCENVRIGCDWQGPRNQLPEHVSNCALLRRTCQDIVTNLETLESKHEAEKNLFRNIADLLNYEMIAFTDLQFRPCYIENDLFYETKVFLVFGRIWMVRARIDFRDDPNRFGINSILYQLILRTETDSSLHVQFVALKGPYSNVQISPQIYNYNFNANNLESNYGVLPLKDANDYAQFMASRDVNFRIAMFLSN
uniref:TRAF-type domain-containing protein n=1 Tax=Glossina pallidipes TaxID=7398 RepID=A0A1A9ZQ54_GLOPL